jgi:hypothetical protein
LLDFLAEMRGHKALCLSVSAQPNPLLSKGAPSTWRSLLVFLALMSHGTPPLRAKTPSDWRISLPAVGGCAHENSEFAHESERIRSPK